MTVQLRASAVALPIEIGELDANLARISDVLDSAEAVGPHLIVFPELATSGYVFRDDREARGLSMRADDPRLASLVAKVPVGAVAVLGFCETDGDRLFNSALIIGHDGILGRYRKSHLWGAEHDVFTPGTEAGAVFDTPIGRLGVAICYDNEFPELPRRLALGGANVLALPVNWPLVDRPPNEHPPETIQAMAAARSSRLATVIADRHGVERGVQWTGGTAVISPDGWISATPADGPIATAVLDLSNDKTLGAHNDLFADRRPELYGEVMFGPSSAIDKRGSHV